MRKNSEVFALTGLSLGGIFNSPADDIRSSDGQIGPDNDVVKCDRIPLHQSIQKTATPHRGFDLFVLSWVTDLSFDNLCNVFILSHPMNGCLGRRLFKTFTEENSKQTYAVAALLLG